MKNLLGIILTLLKMAAITAIISAVFSGLQWLLSLIGICSAPTWEKFIWGGAILFVVFVALSLYRAFKDSSKYKNDITFRLMSDHYGVTAKEYESVYKILQDFAQYYQHDFMSFVAREEYWSVHTGYEMMDKLKGVDKYNYIPIFTNPALGLPDFYIKYDGVIDDKTAIRNLIEEYKRDLAKRGKL